MANGPTPHLSWKELACKDGTPYPKEFIKDRRVYRLADIFEDIRYSYSRPIKVVSAFRTPSWNRKVGGARNSMHMEGRALDLQPPKGISVEEFYRDIRFRAKHLGIMGLGRYETFVHIDIRPTQKIAYWSGTGVKDSGA